MNNLSCNFQVSTFYLAIDRSSLEDRENDTISGRKKLGIFQKPGEVCKNQTYTFILKYLYDHLLVLLMPTKRHFILFRHSASSYLKFLESHSLGRISSVLLKLPIRVMSLLITKETTGNLVARKLLNCLHEDHHSRLGLNRTDVRKIKS